MSGLSNSHVVFYELTLQESKNDYLEFNRPQVNFTLMDLRERLYRTQETTKFSHYVVLNIDDLKYIAATLDRKTNTIGLQKQAGLILPKTKVFPLNHLYHGSPHPIHGYITPTVSEADDNNFDVYAGEYWVALAYCARWQDSDIIQGYKYLR